MWYTEALNFFRFYYDLASGAPIGASRLTRATRYWSRRLGNEALNKRLVQTYPAPVATAYIFSCGTVMMVPIVIIQDGLPWLHVSPVTWLALIVLGVFCSSATNVLWSWGLRSIEASHAGIYTNLEPLVGALLGVVLLHDHLGSGTIVGGILILGASLLITYQRLWKTSD